MKLGLLQCDGLDPEVAAIGGDYAALYSTLLDVNALDVEVLTYRVDRSERPTSVNECDAWLVGGSRASAYDDVDWIHELRHLVGRIIDSDQPLAGVCFGHQMLGLALGAPVSPAENGWTIGAIDYTTTDAGTAVFDASSFTLAASHRDQVADVPDGATLLAASERTPVAAFALDDRIIGIQPHPEFTAAIAGALYQLRIAKLGGEVVDDAIATLDHPLDRELTAEVLRSVLGLGPRPGRT